MRSLQRPHVRHECGLTWQEDAQVVEGASGRPRRAVRNAHGTTSTKATSKSTIVKLAPPKAVGLPKPPQILAKVRGSVIEWEFGFSPVCAQEDIYQTHAHLLYALNVGEHNQFQ
jgi:hypothetical protein